MCPLSWKAEKAEDEAVGAVCGGPGLSVVFRRTSQHTVARILERSGFDRAAAAASAQRSWMVQEEIGVDRDAYPERRRRMRPDADARERTDWPCCMSLRRPRAGKAWWTARPG